jgi:hypothetical protein
MSSSQEAASAERAMRNEVERYETLILRKAARLAEFAAKATALETELANLRRELRRESGEYARLAERLGAARGSLAAWLSPPGYGGAPARAPSASGPPTYYCRTCRVGFRSSAELHAHVDSYAHRSRTR